jgi:sialidase-1
MKNANCCIHRAISFTPRFSGVGTGGAIHRTVSTVSDAAGKLLKQLLNQVAAANTSLKRGVNESNQPPSRQTGEKWSLTAFIPFAPAGLVRTTCILTVFATLGCTAAPQFSDVFIAGKDTFKSIRIPAVVVTKKGTVLAFAEGRAANADQANNKIILKRSADGGRTWGQLQVIAEDGANCLNNPCAVVERETGRSFVMFQSYPAGISERSGQIKPGLEGPAIVRNYLIHSDDDGITWSKLRDVTRTTKSPERVTILASGPGIGIQLRNGPHQGRLIMPFNEGPFGQWHVRAVYSDDRGENWRLGEPAPGCRAPNGKGGEISLVNEVQMVELAGGEVMLNSRKWGGKALRKTAVSKDGGVTWSKIEEEPALRDPGCMASIYRYSFAEAGNQSCLLYSGPDSAKRENGTIYLSHDDGKTWPVNIVLFPGSFAYSVLTSLPDGTIGCLFETDNANRIVFARFTREWLTAGP